MTGESCEYNMANLAPAAVKEGSARTRRREGMRQQAAARAAAAEGRTTIAAMAQVRLVAAAPELRLQTQTGKASGAGGACGAEPPALEATRLLAAASELRETKQPGAAPGSAPSTPPFIPGPREKHTPQKTSLPKKCIQVGMPPDVSAGKRAGLFTDMVYDKIAEILVKQKECHIDDIIDFFTAEIEDAVDGLEAVNVLRTHQGYVTELVCLTGEKLIGTTAGDENSEGEGSWVAQEDDLFSIDEAAAVDDPLPAADAACDDEKNP